MQKESSTQPSKARQTSTLKGVKQFDRWLPLTASCGVLTSQLSIPIDLSNSLGKNANGIEILFQCYKDALVGYQADSLQISFYRGERFIANRIFNFHELMLLSEAVKIPSNYPVRQLRILIPTHNIPLFKDVKIRLFLGEISLNPDLPFNFNVKLVTGTKVVNAKVGEITCSAY